MSTSAIWALSPREHGELEGSATAKRVSASVSLSGAKYIRFRNLGSASNIYLGLANVAVPTGSDNKTAGWPLGPGEESPLLPCDSIGDPWWFICADAADDLAFMTFS